MNTELIQRWVAALRGGQYEQGRGQLRNGYDQYCCLGVLCDLIAPEAWQHEDTGYSHHGACGCLPYAYNDAAGIDCDLEDNLIRQNDGGKTFAQIADFIEEAAGIHAA